MLLPFTLARTARSCTYLNALTARLQASAANNFCIQKRRALPRPLLYNKTNHMDFLDPKKERRHKIRLLVGYVLIGIAVLLTTVILLYQAYGFGVDKHGQVIQSGLVFVSSAPGSANVYVNGQLRAQTNTRLNLPAGQYRFEVSRSGYQTWKRAVTVEGGSVEHFDYPFLFPTKLATSTIKKYAAQPPQVLQSPDRRWLLLQAADNVAKFDMYDLTAKKPAESLKTITLPDGLLADSTGAQTLDYVEWSTDNRHVLLRHTYQKAGQPATEYIMLDRQDATQSVNVSTALGATPTQLTLRDKKYDQYFLFDQTSGAVTTASLKTPAAQPFADHVLAFKSYGSDVMLYATSTGAPAGKVTVKLRQGDKTYTIRQVAASATYVLNLTQYGGSWYVVAGSSAENKVYVYKNPAGVLDGGDAHTVLVPASILKVDNPSYAAFSDNARFIMAENASHFAVYDAENDKGYAYTVKQPLDAPQAHASWMDGHRLTFVSGGKMVVFDFDSANLQTLTAANPGIGMFFDQRYRYVYALTSQPADATNPAQTVLSATALKTPQDL